MDEFEFQIRAENNEDAAEIAAGILATLFDGVEIEED
jgi:hypothetical protein